MGNKGDIQQLVPMQCSETTGPRPSPLPPAGCDALWPGPVVFVLVLLGVFEGFLFALFTCMMFFSQVHAIATDETVSSTRPHI